MAYFNEEFNSMLHKRQEGPAAGNTNNANSQPFPNLPPSPNKEPATQKNGGGGGIGKFQLIGIIVGAVIVLGLIIGIFIRKKVVRERTARNVIKINDVEWDGNSSAGKPTRAIPPQQLRDVYNGQNIGEKSQPSMMIKNSPLSSPQFSNFSSRDQDDASTISITSPLDTPTQSEFQLSDSQRRFQKTSKGHYQHLPRSPRSPLIFKNKTSTTDSDSDQDTLEGTPRSPYFYKGEPSINDQDTQSLEEPPRSPYFYKGGPVPTNTNDQDSTYLDVNNNNYNYEKKNNNINHDENDIIMPPNSDLDNNLKNNNKQYANDLSPSNDDALAPNSFKISWIKDPSYFSKVFTPKELKESKSQTNSIYSTNSIGKNENVQMDYVQPTQGMIQIEMMDEHVITKNDIPKETVMTNFYYTEEEEREFDSPQSEYMAIEYMPVDHESQIVAQLNKMQKIEPIENEFVESNQTNINMEISEPIITGTTKPEIFASKPVVVTPISSIPTSPMYDIDRLKRHAEKVLNAKTEKKAEEEETEDNEIESSSNEGTQGKPLVRKKSVRFQAGLDNDETRPDNDEPLDVSNLVTRKSILMDIMRQSLKPEYDYYEPEDEEEVNNRGSTSSTSSYQVYDFDISSYQDNTDAKVANYI